MQTDKISQEKHPTDAKKIFRKLGTCSRTFFYLLDREFGNLMVNEERAADPLAADYATRVSMWHVMGCFTGGWGRSL